MPTIRCVIGDDRAGVQAFGTACAGIPGVSYFGEIFHEDPQSPIHKHFSSKRFPIVDVRNGTRSFLLYKEFFERQVDAWIHSSYSDRGISFALKCSTYLGSPGLAHYLDSAGVEFIYIRRNNLRAQITSILYNSTSTVDTIDKDVILRVAEGLLTRRAFFDYIAQMRRWPILTTEETFSDSIIDNRTVIDAISHIYQAADLTILVPATRPTADDAKRTRLQELVDNALEESNNEAVMTTIGGSFGN